MLPKTDWTALRRAGLSRLPILATLVVTAGLLAGCSLWDSVTGSSDDDKDATYVERPVEQIYDDAWEQINNHDWLKSGQAIRRSGPPASLFGMGAPRDADERLLLLSGQQIYRRDLDRRPVYLAASRQPRSRLCLLSEGHLAL